MPIKAKLRQCLGDRATLGLVFLASFLIFASLDWLRSGFGNKTMTYLLIGLLMLTGGLVWLTYMRLKASGLKPPSLRELKALREANAAGEEKFEPPKEKGKPPEAEKSE